MARGRLEVICGCMYCGKTDKLIGRGERARYARKKVQAFKHALDIRHGEAMSLASHRGETLEAIAVDTAMAIYDLVRPDTDLILIDEGQFFDQKLVTLCEILVSRGVKVIVAGLDLDFRGEPFEVMAELMARAEVVTKETAICVRCGSDASRSQRIINGRPAPYDAPRIVVGSEEMYEARCRECHEVPGKPPALL